MTKTKTGEKKIEAKEDKHFCFTCFLKGLRVDYSFSEVEGEQGDGMTEKKERETF